MDQNITVFPFRQLSQLVFATTAAASVSFCWDFIRSLSRCFGFVFVLYLHFKSLCLSFNFPFWQAKRHLCCFAVKLQYVPNTVSAGALVVTSDHCHTLTNKQNTLSQTELWFVFFPRCLFLWLETEPNLEWTLLLTLLPIFPKIPWEKKACGEIMKQIWGGDSTDPNTKSC